MTTAYIGLGSNLENPAKHIISALRDINALADCTLLAVSNTYRSIAVGPGEQPDYVNAACALKTTLSAIALLDALQAIEQQHGRVRDIRWGARTLDLDLICYSDLQCETERLILPHPRAKERDFVLRPLLDIAPDFIFPDGNAAQKYLAQADDNGLNILTPQTDLWVQLQAS